MLSEQPGHRRYLVRHDYGMGAVWWWVAAASAAEITTTFAEVEVIDDPKAIHMAQSWSLDEFDIAEAMSGPLGGLYRKRQRQRQDPGFGGDPDAIDRLDTDLDAHEVLSFGSLCQSLHPATIHLAARTRGGTRPTLKSGEAD